MQQINIEATESVRKAKEVIILSSTVIPNHRNLTEEKWVDGCS